MSEIKTVFIKDKNRLDKIYILWAKNLWIENVFFFKLTINFSILFTDNKRKNFLNESEVKGWSESFLTLLRSIAFIEFVHGAFILEKGVLKLYCILGFRSHFNIFSYIRIKLENLLIQDCDTIDFKLSFLSRFKDVVVLLLYMSKRFDENRRFNYAFAAVYSNFFSYTHDILLGPIIQRELYCMESTDISILGDYFCSNSFSLPVGKFSNMGCVPKYLQKESFGCIVYYLLYYFHTKTFIFFQNVLYKKKKEWPDGMHKILGEYVNVNIIFILRELKIIFEFLKIIDLVLLFDKNRKKVIPLLLLLLKDRNLALNLR